MVSIGAGQVLPASSGGRPVRWAATGRSGGVSEPPYGSLNLAGYVGDDPQAVQENQRRVALAVGAADGRLAVMDAVHGADVAWVTEPGVVGGVDALVTREPGLALLALGADCVPLALIGTDGTTIAVAHCGWRGLVADVVGATVGALRESGADVARAVLGPAVCGTCYPVPDDRAREVSRGCTRRVAQAALVHCPDGQPGIDVRLGVVARLGELGVRASAVTLAGGCTAEDPALFSYRRDGRTGRQGMAACLADPARMGTS